MTHRLNARIDDDLAAKLEHLRRQTKQSVTEIVRASIEMYYERFRESGDVAYQVLDRAGFIGCGEGSPDLSTTYKEEFGESLAHKVGG